MPATAEDIEARLGVTLSSRHRAALLDPADPIHAQTLLLGPEGDAQRSRFAVNADLRAVSWKRWPDYLVAFASGESAVVGWLGLLGGVGLNAGRCG